MNFNDIIVKEIKRALFTEIDEETINDYLDILIIFMENDDQV